ncbi:invasion associated locus B family protein [Neiella sp. HB171785]|uniref:Invasion associated locus B family protein n=1 Tax=Neiella litorisoli TaxID=2771431 RepID=A0A8J6QS95_9GAMM|nr:invasion associated locus B family protein [Neiella litorisoli]MBD1389779.1 invasion associated locus B family protein [Neiella litorisoli]
MIKGLIACIGTAFFAFSTIATEQDIEAWTLACAEDSPCTITQLVMAEKAGKSGVVGGVTYFHSANQPILKVRFTPDALKSKGVGLKVDGHSPLHLPITGCDGKVCEVNVAVDNKLLNELTTGKILAVAYVNQANQQMTFPVILTGFDKALSLMPTRQSPKPATI